MSVEKIVERYSIEINNQNLEDHSVCMLMSIDNEHFCDFVYVTQSYQKVFGSDLSFSTANLGDILPPSTNEIHFKLIKGFLNNLESSYLGIKKKGLITLKENVFQDIRYVVKLYPSITVEPMLMLFMRKPTKKDKNKYMIVLNKTGVIKGANEELIKMYPNLLELIDKKIYKLNKDLKKYVSHFKYYELAVCQSMKYNSSIYLPGFRPSKIKEYRETWERLNPLGSGIECELTFNQGLKVVINFKLRLDYYRIGEESNYSIWFMFSV